MILNDFSFPLNRVKYFLSSSTLCCYRKGQKCKQFTFTIRRTKGDDSEEIGLIHGIEDDPAERVVCVVEVLDALVPAAGMQCLHGPLQRLGDDPDAIIGIAMELAGPHA